MPFELRFYGDDAAVVLQDVRALLNLSGAIPTPAKETADVPTATAEIVAPVRRRAAKKDEAQAGQVDLEEAIERSKAQVVAQTVAVSKDQLRSKLIELMNAKGETAPTTLLQDKFGVAKIGELAEAQYGECFAAADAELEAE